MVLWLLLVEDELEALDAVRLEVDTEEYDLVDDDELLCEDFDELLLELELGKLFFISSFKEEEETDACLR